MATQSAVELLSDPERDTIISEFKKVLKAAARGFQDRDGRKRAEESMGFVSLCYAVGLDAERFRATCEADEDFAKRVRMLEQDRDEVVRGRVYTDTLSIGKASVVNALGQARMPEEFVIKKKSDGPTLTFNVFNHLPPAQAQAQIIDAEFEITEASDYRLKRDAEIKGLIAGE